MDPEHIKAKLLAKQQEIQQRLEQTHRHLHKKDQAVSPNFHEQVVETGSDDVVQSLEAEGLEELQQINRALQRLEDGSYPYCSRCGKAINGKRLEAIPYTEYCIDCA